MTNALTVIIPEATANASMRRSLVIDFSLTERKNRPFRGGHGWRYQDILPRARMRRPELRPRSWLRQSGKVSKMVIFNEAALSPLNLRRAS
jgi:hypothetical protein